MERCDRIRGKGSHRILLRNNLRYSRPRRVSIGSDPVHLLPETKSASDRVNNHVYNLNSPLPFPNIHP